MLKMLEIYKIRRDSENLFFKHESSSDQGVRLRFLHFEDFDDSRRFYVLNETLPPSI